MRTCYFPNTLLKKHTKGLRFNKINILTKMKGFFKMFLHIANVFSLEPMVTKTYIQVKLLLLF